MTPPPESRKLSDEVAAWLFKLEVALTSPTPEDAAKLFADECYWRDFVSLTWNIRTVEGRLGIADMLKAVAPVTRPHAFKIVGEAESENMAVAAWFTFETATARGKGHLRLKDGLGFTILTTMTELKGHEERSGKSREAGIVHGPTANRVTWAESRAAEERNLGHTEQPYCLIIGGGQGGIMLGARLKRLGVPTIIIEKNARAGDSWRNRYRTLVLHDPVWYDHFPYLPFPDHWPMFTPKDKIGDWMEMYTRVMELNYWSSTEATKASFDHETKEWTVHVRRDGKDIVLKPKQLVFATGSYGPPREIELPGMKEFAGAQFHSSKHKDGSIHRGKRCIIVGANSSAHDICADLWENGVNVTMIQRTPTTVIKSESLMDVAFAGLYSEQAVEKGIDVDKADMIFASTPIRMLPDAQRPLYKDIAKRDASLIARLNKAGFMTDYGNDGDGLLMKALRTGSGYYIDVGCSELIVRGDVKVRSGVEIARINKTSVTLSDGSELPADVIVYATGYLPMNEWLAHLISRETADLVGPNWGYGSGLRGDPGPWEGELRNMWKPLKQEALWFHGGNLHLSRFNSLFLALQLKARYENIATPVY